MSSKNMSLAQIKLSAMMIELSKVCSKKEEPNSG